MKLHLAELGDIALTNVTNGFIEVTGTLIAQQLKEKREQNHAMLEIASALSYL